MTPMQQLEQLKFDRLYEPKNSLWHFTVTETYPTLPPISYKLVVPDWLCTLYKKQEGGFGIFFNDNPFEALEKKAAALGCELEIYPAFGH